MGWVGYYCINLAATRIRSWVFVKMHSDKKIQSMHFAHRMTEFFAKACIVIISCFQTPLKELFGWCPLYSDTFFMYYVGKLSNSTVTN